MIHVVHMQVEWYYQRAIEIYQGEFGADDENVIKTLNFLVTITACNEKSIIISVFLVLGKLLYETGESRGGRKGFQKSKKFYYSCPGRKRKQRTV